MALSTDSVIDEVQATQAPSAAASVGGSTERRPFPSLFISHGSPMNAIDAGEAGYFWSAAGPALEKWGGRSPSAIIIVSPHSSSNNKAIVSAATQHSAIYDFGGFPAALYKLRYDVSGEPSIAAALASALQEAKFKTGLSDEGGLDHGMWVPLRKMWPAARIPVVPVTFDESWSPETLMEFGGVLGAVAASHDALVIGSGAMTHNLRLFFGLMRGESGGLDESVPGGGSELPVSFEFRTWFSDTAAARGWTDLLDFRRKAPHLAKNHPTDEHLVPWFVAAGAGGGTATTPIRIHDSYQGRCMGYDAYAFGPTASSFYTTLADEQRKSAV